MTSFALIISRGHLIIELSDGKYLIDTGSPSSFGPNDEIEFASNNYYSLPIMREMARLDEMSHFFGIEIQGLIGCDILQNYCVVIDLVDNIMTVSEQKYENNGECIINANMQLLQGVPMINIVINNHVKAFIDTGATISYIKKSYTNGRKAIRTENDAHPMVGNFTTEIFNFDVKIDDKIVNIEMGVLPPILERMFSMFGADAVIGYDLYKDKTVVFDYFSKKFIVE